MLRNILTPFNKPGSIRYCSTLFGTSSNLLLVLLSFTIAIIAINRAIKATQTNTTMSAITTVLQPSSVSCKFCSSPVDPSDSGILCLRFQQEVGRKRYMVFKLPWNMRTLHVHHNRFAHVTCSCTP